LVRCYILIYSYIILKFLSIQDEHHDVAETAVVGFPHEIYGEGIFAYIILKSNMYEEADELIDDLKKAVKSKISSYAVPHEFLVSFLLL
jgi:acetyl-CoA synthetase